MTNRIQQLLKCYKTVKAADPTTLEVSLRDECIDKWTVKFLYPENKCVILDFEFHLVENLPPKVTVVFPSQIQYVCFEELGGKSWTSNNDVPTLIFALQQEYKGRCAVYDETKKLAVAEAINQWKFVQGAHKDWDYIDITERSQSLAAEDIEKWRKEAKDLEKQEEEQPKNDAPASAPEESKPASEEAPKPVEAPKPEENPIEAPQEVKPEEKAVEPEIAKQIDEEEELIGFNLFDIEPQVEPNAFEGFVFIPKLKEEPQEIPQGVEGLALVHDPINDEALAQVPEVV